MAKTRIRYTVEHDKLIKRLGDQGWSAHEVSFQFFRDFGKVRSIDTINAHRTKLIAKGELTKRAARRRYVTQEALDWYNKQFNTDFGVSPMLQLAETKPSNKKPNGVLSSRELIGFTREKGANEQQPTYTVLLMRLQRLNPDALGLFRLILESGVAEEKTAEDMIGELKQALL